jgi:hypothetical protein
MSGTEDWVGTEARLGRVTIVAVLVALLSAGLVGCSGSGGETKDPGAAGSTTSANCAQLEEADSGFRLDAATLTSDDSSITATWKSNDSPPTSGRIVYYLDVHTDAVGGGGPEYLAEVVFVDGELSEYFVSGGLAEVQREDLDPSDAPAFPGESLTASFPLETMAGIKDTFGWQADVAVDDVDISACPSGDGFQPHP